MNRILIATSFIFILVGALNAQDPAKEIILPKSDEIYVHARYGLFKIVHRNNYSLPYRYLDFNLESIDTAGLYKLDDDWTDFQTLEDNKQVGRMYFEEVSYEGEKCLLNKTYRMIGQQGLMGYYSIHYYSKEKIYTTANQISVVLTKYDLEGNITVQKDFSFVTFYRKSLDAMPSHAYFLKNITQLGDGQWMIDTYDEILILDENFKIAQKYKWGESPDGLNVPDAYKYIFKKWNEFAANNQKLLEKKCLYGPTACGVTDRTSKGWTNFYVNYFDGRTFVYIQFFEEARFAVF